MQIWDCLSQLTPEECRLKGFTTSLMCTSCRDLEQFNLQLLVDDCQKCCVQGEAGEAVKVNQPKYFFYCFVNLEL